MCFSRRIRGSQCHRLRTGIPVGDVVESLVGHDENNTHKTYQDLVDDIPAALFGSCICPPEGEADLIILGDSSFALVKNHDNPVTCARLSFGELLQGKEYTIEQIRSVYAGLKWGKGLSAIVHQVWELVDQVERENRLKSRPTLPILVVLGWAGNDVAADFVAKQYEKVQRSLEAVVALSQDPRILSVQVTGNGRHSNYNLPPSYNREMGKHFTWLAERGINRLSSGLLASGGKYDDYHLHDHSYNRKLVYRFLRGAITFHLKYVEIMTKKQLRWFAENFIANEQDRQEAIRLFPTIVQFRPALARTQEVMLAMSPQERTATPAEEFEKADEDILMWVHAGIQEAEQEATREGRPEAQNFIDAEMASIVPVDPRLEDAETEEQRGRLFLQEDLQQAQEDGFSIATVESIELPDEGTDTEADVEIVPDADNWDVIDPEAKAITNPFDEKVKEDEVGEERRKEIEDLNKILSLTSASGMLSGTKATDEGTFTRMEGSVTVHPYMEGSVEVVPMEVDENAAKKPDAPELTGTEADAPRKGEPSSSATEAKDDQPAATEGAPESKPMPRAKAPKLDAEVDRALKKLEAATEAAEQAVWLDPDDMASRIPKEYVGNGRARYISSYLVRGHAIENGALSPEFDPLELCMDFEETMKVINRYIRGVTIKEVLSVVRNNETRRFQIKVTKPDLPEATWKGLPWKVIKIRAVQGHNKSVMAHAKLSNIVKRVFTLDPTFKKEDLDGNKFPMPNLRPDLAPELFKDLPRVIYHSCDRSAMCHGEDHSARVDPRRLATEDREGAQPLYRDPSLGYRSKEAGGNASRKAILYGFRHGVGGAERLQTFSDRSGNSFT
eukprot:s1992_g18.t1